VPTPRPLKLALAGATGAVGRAVLETLEERDLPVETLRLFASPRSAGSQLDFRGDELRVDALADGAFAGLDAAIFATPATVSREWATRAWAAGCVAVDLSAAFRGDPDVPLVVPELNGDAALAFEKKGIVAAPGAPAAALALALAPLHTAAGLERVSAVVLEPASGAGHAGVEQLEREAADLMNGREPEGPGAVPHRLAFNLVPQVGAFEPSGSTDAEAGLAAELRRLLGAPGLQVSTTAVRVPVFYGTVAVVSLAFARHLAPDAARAALRGAAGVKVLDAPGESVYPMPMLAVIDESAMVGRIRATGPRQLELVVSADNLRRGAAANAVGIAGRIAASR